MNPVDVDLDWELGVFKVLRSLWRAIAPTPEPRWGPGAARLEEQHARLAALASMMAGRPVTLEIARGDGGIRANALLLPEAIDRCPDHEANQGLYVLRVCMDATMMRLRPTATGPEATLALARRARELLTEELPRFSEACDAVLAWVGEADVETGACVLWGRLLEVNPPELDEPGPESSQTRDTPVTTEIDVPAIEDVVLLQLEEEVRELPLHSFEKVELIEDFDGNLRQLDGDDELEAQLEALEELDLRHLVRGGPDAGAVLHAEVGLETGVPDISRATDDGPHVRYPEWDHTTGTYRPDWCAVYPITPPTPPPSAWSALAVSRNRPLIERLHSTLLAHRSERRAVTRQLDGDIDLDAVVQARADVLAGRRPTERLYQQRREVHRDVATTVLLDLSLSTDAWIDGVRVLDVARDAILVLGEVAERLHDRVQILAFASHTRNRIRIFNVRDWHEPWSVGTARLEHLRPQGYTRIGPAIRHAVTGLAAAPARRRLLLVITDGKPTDFDRYEGQYGTKDVQRAIQEVTRRGIGVHALAIDNVARHALPTMFGPGRWSILPEPGLLPEALGRAYGRLT